MWRGLWGEWAVRCLDLVLPPLCPLCKQGLRSSHLSTFCDACLVGVLPLPEGHCSRCNLPFRAEHSSAHLCSRCIAEPPAFQQCYSVGLYEATLKQAIQKFKFRHAIGLDRPLGMMLWRALKGYDDIDMIVSVPLHLRQLRSRGYNQSLLLAREVGRRLARPVDARLLVKVRETELQHLLGARQREQNLRCAFAPSRGLQGEKVLLIDDVMTTGATLRSCSRLLLQAGASEVTVAVLARALPPGK